MASKIKIHKNFLFTEGQLINYLKTVVSFSKTEHEILATLTYKKAYEKLYGESTLITFPYKHNKEKELHKRRFYKAEELGKMIKQFSEENSAVDSILVDPKDSRVAVVRPLQIKFLGKGKYKNVTNKKFIEFLKEKSDYEQNDITLILILEGKTKIQLREVVDWLNNHKFPFGEVVLINPDNKTSDMEFYQLKPNKNGFSSMKFDREEMLTE